MTVLVADLRGRALRLQVLTIVWMTVECVVALGSAWMARSPALLGFGGDSAIELLSAIIVFRGIRSRSDSADAEHATARLAGALLWALAVWVIVTASFALAGNLVPQPSLAGIAILVMAAFGMPWLAIKKRKLATEIGSNALRADAVESVVCGYMAWIALAGLLINAIFHKSWADPVAALALVPLVVKEGWQAISAARRCC